ncbi:hypothetical protein [Kineobactrum sediminis]|uniref:hypothetical protein n=1 Tax=Kineobactrum sediminis TaxID=1905677 RepID=UPI0011AF8CA6|nr:hypothetical protein [Kineobactrum sediminis]
MNVRHEGVDEYDGLQVSVGMKSPLLTTTCQAEIATGAASTAPVAAAIVAPPNTAVSILHR